MNSTIFYMLKWSKIMISRMKENRIKANEQNTRNKATLSLPALTQNKIKLAEQINQMMPSNKNKTWILLLMSRNDICSQIISINQLEKFVYSRFQFHYSNQWDIFLSMWKTFNNFPVYVFETCKEYIINISSSFSAVGLKLNWSIIES